MKKEDAKIRILRNVWSEIPFGPKLSVRRGEIHAACSNPLGAVCVRFDDGQMLGVRPDEFEWLDADEAEVER